MEALLLSQEKAIRLGCFFSVFITVALWELLSPRRSLQASKRTRWFGNLSVVVINTLLLRALFPIAAIGLAMLAAEHGWGLLQQMALPVWAAVILATIVLDFVLYIQHVVFHAVPALWRLHRMHHADLDMDVTTGARFHPIEIILSMCVKLTVVAALGPPPVAVLIFEVLLNATAMFNHGNIYIPPALERVVRWFVVTPDMHRIHHSVEVSLANSNFGFNLPWWDRLLGTYRAQPTQDHQEMAIGLQQCREPKQTITLTGMLLLPFLDKDGEYSINRRLSGSAKTFVLNSKVED